MVANWKLIGAVAVWTVSLVIGYTRMQADVDTLKRQVDAIYEVVVWKQNPGNVDLVTNANGLSILYGRGDGTYSTPEPIGSNLWAGAAGDFNRDGWLDLATSNAAGGVSVLINDRSWTGPPPTLTISDAFVTEGHSGTATASFVVTLSSNPTEPVTVNYTTADWTATTADGDYVARTGTVGFAPGDTSEQVTITVNGDVKFEPDETFVVNLSNAVGATIGDNQGVGTILNDDTRPTVSINDVTGVEGTFTETNFTFTVSLTNPTAETVSINYQVFDGTAVARDSFNNALGGIQLSEHDIATAENSATNSADPTVPNNTGGLFCGLFGTNEPFSQAELDGLYRNHGRYVSQVARVNEANVAAGFILPVDADIATSNAATSPVGKG